MDIQTITMDPEEAKEKLILYRQATLKRCSANIREEYRAAVKGYEALAAGTPLINLQEAIRFGGLDEKMRPNLAVARADRKQVEFTWREGVRVWFDSRALASSTESETLLMGIDMAEPHGLTTTSGNHTWAKMVKGWAIIPMAPPEAIEAIGGGSRLKDHMILWEVEEWADTPIQVQPDRDPLLLRLITGDLYAVVAQWDLTELERQVMTNRRNG